MSIALFTPRVGIIVALCVMLFAFSAKFSDAEGNVQAGEFVEGLNLVVWTEDSGFSAHPSEFVETIERESGLSVVSV